MKGYQAKDKQVKKAASADRFLSRLVSHMACRGRVGFPHCLNFLNISL
jgi:hypothetical protein